MKIKNFEYNGFFGTILPGFAEYTVEFKEWTRDPGIFIGTCSDGKERFIPTFALEKEDYKKLSEQPKENRILFGYASNS